MTDEVLVERVAKVIAFAHRSRHDQARDADHLWQHLGEETRFVERAAAQAAIEEIRKAQSEDPGIPVFGMRV